MNSKLIDALKKFAKGDTETYIFTIFLSIGILMILKVIGASAWITIGFLILMTFLIWFKISDLATSFILMAIFAMQFYVPNKYYIVQVFKPFDLLIGVGSYNLSYGINLQNIFILVALLLVFRNLLLHKWKIDRKILYRILPVFISGILFFLVSLYSSLNFSPYTTLSVTWLIQYMQMFAMAFILFCIFINSKINFRYIVTVLLASTILQSVISIMQFLKQASIGLPVESFRYQSVYYGAPDAVRSIFRASGTFGGPNQLALVLCGILPFIIPTLVKKKQPIYMIGTFMSIVTIILTQSRSAWIALAAILIICSFMYKGEIQKVIAFFGKRRIYIIILLMFLATSVALISRIAASLNAFYEGAGAPLRTEMLKEAELAVAQNPWIGYGIGTNEHVLLSIFPVGYNYSFPAPVHIAYVQLLLESGLIGLFSFIFPYLYISRYIINKYLMFGIKKIQNLKSYIFVFVSGMAAFGLFYMFQPHQGHLEFSYLGITLGYGTLCVLDLKRNKNEI